MSMVYKAEKSNDSNKNNCSCTKMQKLQENNEKGEKNSHTKIQNDSLCQESNKWLKSNSCTQIQASMVENSAKCQSNNYPPPKKKTNNHVVRTQVYKGIFRSLGEKSFNFNFNQLRKKTKDRQGIFSCDNRLG